MSSLLGPRLPAKVMALFEESQRANPDGQCLILVTVDPNGSPRPCLLSVGEMLALDDCTLRALVWRDSQTTANLRRGNPALFVLAVPPDAFHVRATPQQLPDAPSSSLARFEFTISSVEIDGHDGMPVAQPMWFTTRDDLRPKVLDMWAEQLEALRHDIAANPPGHNNSGSTA